MQDNEQVLSKAIIAQEKAERAPELEEDKYFQLFVTQLIMRKYDLDDAEGEDGITDGSHDGGCDGIYLFVNGELVYSDYTCDDAKRGAEVSFHIIQCKNTSGFSEEAIMKWKTLSENLFKLETDYSQYEARYNEKILEKVDLLRSVYTSLIRKAPKLAIHYHYASLATEVSQNVLAQADELKQKVKTLFPSASVEVDFITAGRIHELYNAHENSDHVLACTEIMNASAEQEFIVLATLPNYYHFITDESGKIIRHIFESNVRDYQGQVTVNKQIEETLENGMTQEDFWWLNNGVTILAKAVQQETGKHLLISEPEIVNGLQSSSEIYAYFSRDKSRLENDIRNVLVRVIVPKSEESRDHIILATNSQTVIPKSSLRATDIIHRNIEQFFKSKGLYYDRRKNFYKNQGMPIDKIISLPFLGQCLMTTILAQPDYARARPSTLLEKEATYKKLYNNKISLQSYYNIALIGRFVSNTVKHEEKYTPTEKSNILFATIFYYVSTLVGSMSITSTSIERIDSVSLKQEDVIMCADKVLNIYYALGGTDKVAKNDDFTKAIKAQFEKDMLERASEVQNESEHETI